MADPAVVVIEDEPEIRRFLRVTLHAQSYRLFEAATGGDGLVEVATRQPDVVIVDLGLPDIDGLEVIRRIREWSSVPVIVLSARGGERDKVMALDAGADDYVEKPFDPADLLRRIETLLNRAPAGAAPAAEVAARQQLKEGVTALKQEQLDDAIAAFQRGLALDGFNDLLHYYLALAYEKKGMAFHAVGHYERAIQINREFYDGITALARLYEMLEFRLKAVEMWELALAATTDEDARANLKAHLLSLL